MALNLNAWKLLLGGEGGVTFILWESRRLCPLWSLISTSYNKMVPESHKSLWNSVYRAYL